MISIKFIKSSQLYNMMQDMRHLVIIDVRNEQLFDNCQIINSLNMDLDKVGEEQYIEKVLKMLYNKDEAAIQYEKKYNYKKIRRIVFVQQKNQNVNNHIIIQKINTVGIFDKIMVLEDEVDQFKSRYQFLCVNQQDIEQMNKQQQQKDKIQQNNYLFAQQRFPTEINDNLFIGGILNGSNKKQLQCLNINSVLDLVKYEDNEKVDLKVENYFNVGINKEDNGQIIDLDSINEWIYEQIYIQKKKVMVMCIDGDQYSPCIAIAFILAVNKISINVISLQIFQKRGVIQVDKHFYAKVLAYTPNLKYKI